MIKWKYIDELKKENDPTIIKNMIEVVGSHDYLIWSIDTIPLSRNPIIYHHYRDTSKRLVFEEFISFVEEHPNLTYYVLSEDIDENGNQQSNFPEKIYSYLLENGYDVIYTDELWSEIPDSITEVINF